MNTLIILDVSNLAYRYYYAIKELTHENLSTGIAFGIFRDMVKLSELYNSNKFVFCFDQGIPIRTKMYPQYKQKRRTEKTPEQDEAHKEVWKQIDLLKEEYLPKLGYKNILSQEGIEADDLMAEVCLNCNFTEKDYELVLVSSDQDLYQLLSVKSVHIWNPHTGNKFTREDFTKKYEIVPYDWIRLKAMVGCSTDQIEGILGVGEKTGIKYIKGLLQQGVKRDRIIRADTIIRRNEELIRLPFPGTKPVKIVGDEFTNKKWHDVTKSLGMESLMNNPPCGS